MRSTICDGTYLRTGMPTSMEGQRTRRCTRSISHLVRTVPLELFSTPESIVADLIVLFVNSNLTEDGGSTGLPRRQAPENGAATLACGVGMLLDNA